jgi:ABC-2 type transport system ATP-binding protein
VIQVEGLTRKFGAFTAVDSLSFTLERGEVVGFLGPNGAGKTTTLRILAGYLPATSGSARIAGFDVLRESLQVRQRIGYLPESVPLYGEHRVQEMMQFQARLHGMRRAEYVRRIPEVLERAGIGDRAQALINGLSRGQRQRVGIAVALLPKPEVLILDEPTSGLDPLQRIEMRKLLRELGSQHTVLISSHILPEIEAVCPRVIILSRGKIAADGTPNQLVRRLTRSSFVRVEAVVGHDAAAAVRLLETIRGVGKVIDGGRIGIHHRFDLPCEEDLREDVGALAAQRGWALRELAWHRPTLEQLFARIALDLADHEPHAPEPEPPAETSAAPASNLVQLAVANTSVKSEAPAAPAAPKRVVYNLNPFDAGAARDLGAPKAVDAPPPRDP